MQRQFRFRWLAVVQVVSYGVGFGIVGLGLALTGHGAWSLVAAQLTQSVVGCGISLWLQPHEKQPQVDLSAARELIRFGGGFTAARAGNYVATQGDNAVVGRWLGAEMLGLYGRAFQLVVMPATLLGLSLIHI